MNYYAGVDLGGTNIKAGIIDENGNVIHKDLAPTGAGRPYGEIIEDIARLVKKVIADSGVDEGLIKSIGIGNPGTCDVDSGVVICASNLGFENVPMRDEMKKYFDIPIYIGNDANCAALGEYYALDGDVSDMVFITLGTGVGGGIIINKRLYTGANGTAAEGGHMIFRKDGIECACGAKGCWESYASVTALIRMTKEYADKNPDSAVAKECINGVSGKTVFNLMKKGDAGAKSIVDEWIGNVATGIISIINLLQPQILVIGGAISKEGSYLLDPIRAMQLNNKYSEISDRTELVIAKLGNDAGLVGSAFLGKGEN